MCIPHWRRATSAIRHWVFRLRPSQGVAQFLVNLETGAGGYLAAADPEDACDRASYIDGKGWVRPGGSHAPQPSFFQSQLQLQSTGLSTPHRDVTGRAK